VAKTDYSSQEIDIALAAFAVEGGRQKPTEKLLRSAKLKVPFSTLRGWAYGTYKDRYQQIAVEVEKEVRVNMADTYHRLAKESAELSEDVLDRIRSLFRKRDKELGEVEVRLEDCEDELKELATAIGVAQARLAESLEIPNVDALIEEVLGERGDEADAELVGELTQLYRRREGLVNESAKLWDRRERLEVSFRDLTKVLHEAGVMGGIATDKHAVLTGQATERVEHSFPELQRALEAKGIRLNVGQGAPRAALPAAPPVIDLPSTPADG
jgi:hypothetical protein